MIIDYDFLILKGKRIYKLKDENNREIISNIVGTAKTVSFIRKHKKVIEVIEYIHTHNMHYIMLDKQKNCLIIPSNVYIEENLSNVEYEDIHYIADINKNIRKFLKGE